MINDNLYQEAPSYTISRDPREINAVARLEEIRNSKRTSVNDEDIQFNDHPLLMQMMKANLDKLGVVQLNSQGKIDSTYLPEDYEPSDPSEPSVSSRAIVTASTHLEFPTVGEEDKLYIATTENGGKGYIYRWCGDAVCYQRPDDELNNISEIYGGSAEF